MSTKKPFLTLLVVLSTTALPATEAPNKPQDKPADQAAAKAPELPTEPVIPKRELKFDVSEEEQALPLVDLTPALLEERYVATFRLPFPVVELPKPLVGRRIDSGPGLAFETSRSRVPSSVYLSIAGSQGNTTGIPQPSGLSQFERLWRELAYPGLASAAQPTPFPTNLSVFTKLARNSPEQHRPPEAVMATFTGENVALVWSRSQYAKNDPFAAGIGREIAILTPTVAEAKQRAEGWLALYDWGLCHPAQQICLRERTRLEEQVAQWRARLPKAEVEAKDYHEQLEKYKEFADIDPREAALANLTTQRRLLAAELAGIQARIDACNRMLAEEKGKHGAATRLTEQIEAAKVAAEIELVGAEAKHREINRVIEGVKARQQLLRDSSSAHTDASNLPRNIARGEAEIQAMEYYRSEYEPLAVQDGTIHIRPIKWVNPSKTEK